MADWYVSSAAWAAIAQFAVSGVYTVGQIVRPLTAPTFNAQYTFRCTTAGTAGAEPAWTSAPVNGNTVTSGGATFTNVSGQSTYGWSAAAGNLYSITTSGTGGARAVVGDRIFLSSDHLEATASALFYDVGATGFGLISIISVNRAGSVPPVAADIAAGATIESTGTQLYIDNPTNQYWSGITFKATGAGASCNYFFGSGGAKTHYLTNCLLWVNNTTASSGFRCNGSIAKIVLDNTTVRFGAVGQQLFYPANGYPTDVTWQNSPTPIHASGSVPTALFAGFGGAPLLFTLRGVDLSLLTTTLFVASANASVFNKVLLDSCRIAAGLTRYTSPGAAGTSSDEVELVNCFDGTNILSERHTPAGDVNTDKSTTMVGGAQDDVGLYSTKLVSSSRSDPFAMTLDSFWMDVELTTTGAPRTATVEIISSASLNNTDINLMLEYQGTAGSSLGTFAYSLPSPLTPSAAVPTSTVTWNNQPTTPVKQHLQVTFTPQVAGRVRGIVRLGKVSTTVWINPQVIIT